MIPRGIVQSFPQVAEAIRMKQAYDGLRTHTRPRFVYRGLSRYDYLFKMPWKKTASKFYMGWSRNHLGGLRDERGNVPIIMGGAPDDYYLRADGTAANLGVATGPGSSQSDCASIATFNAGSPAAGDRIYACDDGGIFRAQLSFPTDGTIVSPISLLPEPGDSPQFFGSNLVSGWADQGGNIWRAALGTDPPVVWFIETDESIVWGNEVANVGSLAAEYDWVWDTSYLYCYAASDPDSRYGSIETSSLQSVILNNNRDYIEISGLEIAFAGGASATGQGVRAQFSTGTLIENCYVHHCGEKDGNGAHGVALYCTTSCTIRGNRIGNGGAHGTYTWNDADGDSIDNVIELNEVYDSHHANIDCHSLGATAKTNTGLIIRYNDVYNTENFDTDFFSAGIQILATAGNPHGGAEIYYNITHDIASASIVAGQYTQDVHIYNNVTCRNLTGQTNVGIKVENGAVSGIIIKNNISVDHSQYCLFMENGAESAIEECDYNLWFNSVATYYTVVATVGYAAADQAAYKSATGFDTNGLWENPDLLNQAGNDFHLKTESPCIEAGTPIVGLTVDFDGIPLGRGTNPDIGAFETLKGGPRGL